MIKKNSTTVAAMMTVVTLVGCASRPLEPPPSVDPLGAALTRSSERVEAALLELARASISKKDAGGGITVDWVGEASPVVASIAQQMGKRFLLAGRPGVSLPVSIKESSIRPEDALKIIGVQLGDRADLVLLDDAVEMRVK